MLTCAVPDDVIGASSRRYGYFVNKTAHIAIAQGRRPVQWNEVFLHFGTEMYVPYQVQLRLVILDLMDMVVGKHLILMEIVNMYSGVYGQSAAKCIQHQMSLIIRTLPHIVPP